MIICTSCNHENPEGSVQCESCYATLPKTSPCPNCGAFTQINAAFCGQCGYNLLSEEPLAFVDQDDESENLLESKATIPHQNIDYSFEKPWETQTKESEDNSEILNSDLEIDETEFIVADSSEELEIEGPDLDLAPEILEEPVAIADEIVVEPEELEELSFDLNAENDSLEPDLEPDVERDLEAELPGFSDLDRLEMTNAMSESELPQLDELEIESPDLDIDAEIPEESGAIVDEIAELEDLEEPEELEELSLDLKSENDSLEPDLEPDVERDLEAELPEFSDLDQLEATTAMSESELPQPDELEIESPDLDIAAEIPEESGAIADEIAELEDLEEPEELEDLEEPEELEELSLDLKSENDSLEADLEPDIELDLEAKLPELSDMDELEDTTDRSVSELSTVEEEEFAVEHSELDVAAEISETAEPSLLEKLESLETDERPSQPTQETATPAQEQAPEIKSPEVNSNVASEIPAMAEPAIAQRSAIPSPRSWAKPLHPVSESATQLQLERIILFHVQTNTDIELAQNLDIIRIGKPNNQVPPDIDVSGFPDANIVSRVHANIRVEGNLYFIEDAGSSNGTYINHKPLDTGNRHRLRFGDRISLGKGDLMTFIFKIIDD